MPSKTEIPRWRPGTPQSPVSRYRIAENAPKKSRLFQPVKGVRPPRGEGYGELEAKKEMLIQPPFFNLANFSYF
jgi:hypothetical protein